MKLSKKLTTAVGIVFSLVAFRGQSLTITKFSTVLYKKSGSDAPHFNFDVTGKNGEWGGVDECVIKQGTNGGIQAVREGGKDGGVLVEQREFQIPEKGRAVFTVRGSVSADGDPVRCLLVHRLSKMKTLQKTNPALYARKLKKQENDKLTVDSVNEGKSKITVEVVASYAFIIYIKDHAKNHKNKAPLAKLEIKDARIMGYSLGAKKDQRIAVLGVTLLNQSVGTSAEIREITAVVKDKGSGNRVERLTVAPMRTLGGKSAKKSRILPSSLAPGGVHYGGMVIPGRYKKGSYSIELLIKTTSGRLQRVRGEFGITDVDAQKLTELDAIVAATVLVPDGLGDLVSFQGDQTPAVIIYNSKGRGRAHMIFRNLSPEKMTVQIKPSDKNAGDAGIKISKKNFQIKSKRDKKISLKARLGKGYSGVFLEKFELTIKGEDGTVLFESTVTARAEPST